MTLDHLPSSPRTFADVVRHCRDERGLTQHEFAALFNGQLSQVQVGKWEMGQLKAPPRRENLLRLAELCRHRPGELIDLIGYPGAALDTGEIAEPKAPALRDLLRVARALTPRQLRALIAVAREMARE